MNNIRKDNTKSNPESRARWELDVMTGDDAREDTKQKELLNSWAHLYGKDRSESQLKEAEMMRRVGAITEGDTSEARTAEKIRNLKFNDKVDAMLRSRVKIGQSESEFEDEIKGFGAEYKKIVRLARQEVQKEENGE